MLGNLLIYVIYDFQMQQDDSNLKVATHRFVEVFSLVRRPMDRPLVEEKVLLLKPGLYYTGQWWVEHFP